MKKCPNCETITNSKFCPECGKNLADVEEITANDEEQGLINAVDAEDTNAYGGEPSEVDNVELDTSNEPKINKTEAESNTADPATQEGGAPSEKGKSKKKIIAIVAAAIVVIIAAVAFLGIRSAREKAAQEAYDNALVLMRANSGMMQMDVVSNPVINLAEPG